MKVNIVLLLNQEDSAFEREASPLIETLIGAKRLLNFRRDLHPAARDSLHIGVSILMEPSYGSYNRSNRNVSRFGDGAEALNDVTVVCGRTITTKQKVHDLSFGETSPIDPLLHFDESQAAVCRVGLLIRILLTEILIIREVHWGFIIII